KLIQASAVLDLTEDDFDFLTSNKVWIATDRSRARRCVEACVYGTLDFVGYPRFPAPVEFIAAVIAYYVHPTPTATKEIQYLNAKGALTYTDIAGDPVLYGNLPPREISMKDVFRSGDSSKKFKIAEGQWYRYAPSYVSP